jgi:hypothetical protein
VYQRCSDRWGVWVSACLCRSWKYIFDPIAVVLALFCLCSMVSVSLFPALFKSVVCCLWACVAVPRQLRFFFSGSECDQLWVYDNMAMAFTVQSAFSVAYLSIMVSVCTSHSFAPTLSHFR